LEENTAFWGSRRKAAPVEGSAGEDDPSTGGAFQRDPQNAVFSSSMEARSSHSIESLLMSPEMQSHAGMAKQTSGRRRVSSPS
jgi:hypothetical protein